MASDGALLSAVRLLCLLFVLSGLETGGRAGRVRIALKDASSGISNNSVESSESNVIESAAQGSQNIDDPCLPLHVDISDFNIPVTLGQDEAIADVSAAIAKYLVHARLRTKHHTEEFIMRNIFFLPTSSHLRQASDRLCAWYLRHFGDVADKIAYSSALSVRWAVEHPKISLSVLGGCLFAYWYANSACPHEKPVSHLAELERPLVEEEMRRMSSQEPQEALRSALKLAESGQMADLVLLSAQTLLLTAAQSGQCTLQRIASAMQYPYSAPALSKETLVELTNMEKMGAKEHYAALAPLYGKCGEHDGVVLSWNDANKLIHQLTEFGLLE
eukprot:TRINITY_DN20093_c0_g8_i1.p1 TRINITY_DN20093_c0_g8~~TRINITY_DN20093_c0_g8_i1.p1  ORF type:complete len:331 (-),score=28.50 TRINITY_DN20093_c0_g8_i1:4-996(-)